MKKISIAVAVTVLTAAIAAAEPSMPFKEWVESPVKFLMTKAEKETAATISNEADAQAFVALFWARRDPTPATYRNELREEFDKRVALADQHFTTKRTRGAMTDRGRTLILLGSPATIGGRGAAAGADANPNFASADDWDGQVRGPRGQSALLSWTYANDKKPKYIKRKDFAIMFSDESGDGQWELVKGGKTDPEMIFQEAIDNVIFSPEMTQVPAYADSPVPAATQVAAFKNASLKSAYDQFKSAGKASDGPALLTWGEFVTPDGDVFVPVQLFVPAGSGIDAGRKLTFFGVVEDGSGKVVDVHEDAVTLAASGRDAYIDKSLRLEPGSYKATFGLAEGDKILAISRTDMTVNKLDPAESAISDMILSNNAYPLPEAQKITDPFAFGGLKVVPKADGRFSTKDDIWYFYELRNPGLTEAGLPKVQAKIDIEGTTDASKPVKMNFPWQEYETIPLKGVKNHFGLGMSFPLSTFKPGKYTVKIKVIDTILKKTYESERKFEITS